jgi:hypothetical protein
VALGRLLALLGCLLATPANAAEKPRADARESRPPEALAAEARDFEDRGAYARAADVLLALRGAQGPDADLEVALAIDEARAGRLDSAAVRLSGPLLSSVAYDTLPRERRAHYSWRREQTWIDGGYGGWPWYIWRARAEVAARRGRWREATEAARVAVASRPLSGKEWLILAVAAGQAGLDAEAAQAAEAAKRRDPTLPEAFYLSGLWAWRDGRRAEAQESFRRAVALDSSYGEPALALVKARLPGTRPDPLPTEPFTGARRVALLTSSEQPKVEEFEQMDTPARVASRRDPPIPDSLAAAMQPNDLLLQILIDDRGRVVLHDLPWFTPLELHPDYLSQILAASLDWRFVPARRSGVARSIWATIKYEIRPQPPTTRKP